MHVHLSRCKDWTSAILCNVERSRYQQAQLLKMSSTFVINRLIGLKLLSVYKKVDTLLRKKRICTSISIRTSTQNPTSTYKGIDE